MKILWFTWKDLKHPLAGGAEVVNEELARRLAGAGHQVKLIVGGYPGAPAKESIAGYEVVRLGSRYTVYYHAWRYYHKHLRGWADLVVDEVNTVPFFAKFYVHEPVIMFFHMLCREIWFYQMPLPLSLIGYLIEPLYLRLLANQKTIAMSGSTKQDLLRHGFKPANISLVSEGIELKPLAGLSGIIKLDTPTMLSFGAIRPMKRTLHQLKAFELAKRQMPELKLIVAGSPDGAYGRQFARAVELSPFKKDITILGRVSVEQKIKLMQQAHVIAVTSVKEGWGLIVTEAASQGTPAVVYDVDGLRDSVRHKETGYVTAPNPTALAAGLIQLLGGADHYPRLRQSAWEWSKQVNFDQSYSDFMKAVSKVSHVK